MTRLVSERKEKWKQNELEKARRKKRRVIKAGKYFTHKSDHINAGKKMRLRL